MKKLFNILVILISFSFFSKGQDFRVELDANSENWILISDSLNYEKYYDPHIKKVVRIFYDTKFRRDIEVLRFTYNKSEHSMSGFKDTLDTYLTKLGHRKKNMWVWSRSDGAYKYQLVDHRRENNSFSIVVQPFSWRE